MYFSLKPLHFVHFKNSLFCVNILCDSMKLWISEWFLHWKICPPLHPALVLIGKTNLVLKQFNPGTTFQNGLCSRFEVSLYVGIETHNMNDMHILNLNTCSQNTEFCDTFTRKERETHASKKITSESSKSLPALLKHDNILAPAQHGQVIKDRGSHHPPSTHHYFGLLWGKLIQQQFGWCKILCQEK